MKYDIDKIIKESRKVKYDFEAELLKPLDDTFRDYYNTEKYFKLLTATSQLYPSASYLELGTFTGASALAYKYGNPLLSKILTCDIVDNRKFIKDGDNQIKFIKTDVRNFEFPEKHYDVIFIDISHNGEDELKLMASLLKQGLLKDCLVFFDDIRLNKEMMEFWRQIEAPFKKGITDHGHASGTGVCIYE